MYPLGYFKKKIQLLRFQHQIYIFHVKKKQITQIFQKILPLDYNNDINGSCIEKDEIMGLQFYSRFGSPDAIAVTNLKSVFNSSLNAFLHLCGSIIEIEKERRPNNKSSLFFLY